MAEDKRPSEFGGRPGLVQRLEDGHVPTPDEERTGLFRVDAMDAAGMPEWGQGGQKVQ